MNQSNMGPISVYTVNPFKKIPPLFFLSSVLNRHRPTEAHFWNLFQGDRGEARFDFLRFVHDPKDADFFLLPHKYSSLKKTPKTHARALLSHFVRLARLHGKKILIFALADSDEHIDIPHSYIFRYSQYRYKKKDNEVMIPPYVFHVRSPKLVAYREDAWKKIALRQKAEMPTVSFCGWAGFSSAYDRAMYGFALLAADFQKHVLERRNAELHKPGIYFRRKSLKYLAGSKSLSTRFIARRSFSAQSGFGGKYAVDPESAEKDNVESIIHSDFVLSPKGHANESIRFYEALSLGRLPVLIDTDKILPLEHHIDYGKFVVRVDYTKIEEASRLIVDFYHSMDDEEFKKRQEMARRAFELLRPGSCIRILLSELKQKESGYHQA